MVTDRSNENTFYNAADLNRVEAKTAEVAGLLTAQGYVATVSVKTDWVKTDMPYDAEMKRFLGNVRLCVNQFCAVPGVTLPPTMRKINYEDANNIEKTLVGIEQLLDYMLAVMYNMGSYNCGFDTQYGLRGCTI